MGSGGGCIRSDVQAGRTITRPPKKEASDGQAVQRSRIGSAVRDFQDVSRRDAGLPDSANNSLTSPLG